MTWYLFKENSAHMGYKRTSSKKPKTAHGSELDGEPATREQHGAQGKRRAAAEVDSRTPQNCVRDRCRHFGANQGLPRLKSRDRAMQLERAQRQRHSAHRIAQKSCSSAGAGSSRSRRRAFIPPLVPECHMNMNMIVHVLLRHLLLRHLLSALTL